MTLCWESTEIGARPKFLMIEGTLIHKIADIRSYTEKKIYLEEGVFS